MSDLLVDGELVREVAHRIDRLADTLADAPAAASLVRAADAMPGSRTGDVAVGVSRSWGRDEDAVIGRQRGLAAGTIDALAELDRTDAELAGSTG